jgi:thioredoxin-dependent peroxiredoxin
MDGDYPIAYPPRMLKVGDKAPRFALPSDAGTKVKLSELSRGGKHVVVYFYPKDSTPGCTREAQGFSSALKAIEKLGASVVGISKDSVQSHCNFRDKFKLKVLLLSDPELEVHKAFGAYGDKVMYGKKVKGVIRSTFIVAPDGTIARVFPSVKVDGHIEKVVEVLGELGGAPAKKAPTRH